MALLAAVPPSPSVKPRVDGWKFRWDVVVFLAFVLAAMRHWTELFWHEIIGVMVVPVLTVHLWLNWNWIVDVLRRAARTLPGEVRFNRGWDVAQSVVAFVAIGSGLAVSRHVLPGFGVTFARNHFLEDVHAVSAWVLMVMIGIHLGMHAHWVWSKVRKPQFALTLVLLVAAAGGVTRLEVLRQDGAFSRRWSGDANKVALALIPPALIAFGALVVVRRRRAS